MKKNTNLIKKRKQVIRLIETLDEAHLDALMTLLTPQDNLYVSESDWAEIEYRSRKEDSEAVKMIPAKTFVKKLNTELKRKRK